MHVFIVDDNAELRDLLTRSLEGQGDRVQTACTATEAEQVLSGTSFDVIVLDIALPDGSGLDVCRNIRRAQIPTPILMLTAHASVSERVSGLDAGADDFMGKPFAVAELRARIRALGRRRGLPLALLWTKADVELDFAKRRARVVDKEVPLTAREWSILEVLVNARGRVVPRTRILEEVWGDATESTAASLDVLIARIRKKLGEDIVRTARGEGYALA